MIICFLRTSELYYLFFIHIIINILSTAVGIEWILDNDASSAAVLVASEAHAITLAIEGLLGVVFTVATLTDEAVDVGEVIDAGFSSAIPFSCLANIIFFLLFACLSLFSYFPFLFTNHQLESPRYEHHPSSEYTGKTSNLCISMVDSLWLTILDAFSLILSRYNSPSA